MEATEGEKESTVEEKVGWAADIHSNNDCEGCKITGNQVL